MVVGEERSKNLELAEAVDEANKGEEGRRVEMVELRETGSQRGFTAGLQHKR